MEGVQPPGDSEVLVISTFGKAAALEKADHAYQLVIGCWMIIIAVDHINRFKPVRNRSCNKIDRVQT